GLEAFGPGDAELFVGRERETEAFVNRLRVQPLLALFGPSGAGKSSFVQAGVIPSLPAGWRAITMRPGAAPFDALAAALAAAQADLVRMLTVPARRRGYDFDDPELPIEMARAVVEQPGALPLLSFTALELWNVRDRHFKQLSRKAYEAMAGIGGALAQHAERT